MVAATTTTPAEKTAAPAKPAASIDPLSVPLSRVPPLLPFEQHALENQLVAGQKASHRSYYIVVAVLVAMTLGAMLAIPRLRDRQSEPDSTSAPAHPAAQPDAPLTPANVKPPAASDPQPTAPQKQATPERSLPGPAQRSGLRPEQSSPQESVKAASEKQFVKKEKLAADSAPAPAAATSSASLRSEPVPTAASTSVSVASSGAVTPGEVLNQVLPDVSAKSRSTIHGTVRVVVKVHVDPSGSVTSVDPASTPSKFFGDAAVEAAKRWDFAPAKIADHAVASEWLLRFDFTQAETKVLPSQTKP